MVLGSGEYRFSGQGKEGTRPPRLPYAAATSFPPHSSTGVKYNTGLNTIIYLLGSRNYEEVTAFVELYQKGTSK